MYIAKGIIEQHGGSLTVDSEGIGKGTCFTLKIPLYDVPADKLLEERKNRWQPTTGCAEVSDRDGSSSPGDPLNVLVVDDSAMNRKLLVRILQNQGHTCVEAENGLVAVQRVQESIEQGNLFDSILMDYHMPELNGPLATKKIREMGSDAFIVGITGALFSEQINHFVECGANRVLPKPLNMSALMDTWMEHGVL